MRKKLLRRRAGRAGLRRVDPLNPIEGAFNLVDAMLVFACGLMVALILNWNIQLSAVKIDFSHKEEINQDIENITDNALNLMDGTSYEKMGAVYRDPETGKLYLLNQEQEGR